MKNYTVHYTKGHLVDTNTGKRIFLKRGGKFTILGDDNQFEVRDELALNITILDSEEKLSSLKKEFKDYFLEKVACSGQRFIYRIGLSKKTSEDKVREFLFDAFIKEDLYMRSKNGNDWSLCDCFCETHKCLQGDIQMFETIYGKSLNNLFSNMVAFYFPMQRSGAINAFTGFYMVKNENPAISDLKSKKFWSLDEVRRIIIMRYKNKS